VSLTQRDPADSGAGFSRRALLVAGGLVLIGGCASPVSDPRHRQVLRGNPQASKAGAATLSGTRPVIDHEAIELRAREAHRRRPALTADEQPMYYVHDGPRAIALTIDDGPDPVYTPQVLRLLHKYRVTASFSMIGIHVDAYPGLARRVADAGHMIVNHTQTHPDLALMTPAAVRDEMSYASEAIHRATGRHPGMFRAPYGAWSPAVMKRCRQMGMVPLDWSVDPRDWAEPGVAAIVDNIMDFTRTGSIILEHDGGGNRSQTVAALRIVLPRLLHAGYHFTLP
jgi:peptidoglycan-N-acetylglucosamine deacetylase